MTDMLDQPAADEPRNPSKDERESKSRGRLFYARQVVSVILVLLVVACIVAVVLARAKGETIGFDVANVLTFVLTALSLILCIPLILLRTRFSLFARLMMVSVVVLLICAPLLTVRIDGFDGRLVPIVRWAWEEKPAPLTDAPKVSGEAEADLTTRTEADFPQFLGPDRNLDLPNTFLVRDWRAAPPQLVWRRPIGAGWSGFAVVNGFAVTMEQRGSDEVITCYAVESGNVIWAHSYAARHETVMGGLGPRCTPTIDEGMVYALGATGILTCVRGNDGELVWRDDLLQRCGVTEEEELRAVSWGRAASPLVVDDLLVVPLGGPQDPEQGPRFSLVAFDKITGETRWTGGDQQVGYASPSLATLCSEQQILIMNEDSVSGHRIDDGEVLWSYPLPGKSNAEANCSQAVAVSGDRVVLTNRRMAELIQVRSGPDGSMTAESIWVGRGKLKTKFTNVVVRDGFIYGLSDGILECVELDTGKRRWKNRRGDYGHGQILAVGDVLLVQAETGEVAMVELNPDQLVELGRFEALSERTWNTPCLYGSRLLVRNASEAACYRVQLRD